MSEIVLSSSSNSIDKAKDKYHDTSFSGSSGDNSSGSNSSSGGNTTDEYTSGIPRIPLEVFQEQLRTRVVSGSRARTSSAPSSTL